MDQYTANPSSCDSTSDQLVVKQEPDAENISNMSYDDGFIGAALLDSLRNVPDPLSQIMPRGKKNPIVTLDSIKKELHHECKTCGKRFRKTADYYQHQTTHSNPLDCDLCSERFYKPWDLTKHQMEKHSGSTMHKCKICSKTFIEHWRLLRHMRTHSDDKKFQCDICDKAFSESGNLAKHKRRVHLKDRPFKCEVCDKTYPQKKDLQGHMLVHTMKRFSCSVCKEEFAQIDEKRAHMKAIHPHETVEKSFSCVLCNVVFNSKTKYHNHCLTHGERNFQCPHCPKKFHTIPRLRKHVRAHRTEEHSRCGICFKSFSQDSNMKRHIEIMHMRDNRYYCLHCPLMFELADELRLHRESTHANELPFKCAFCEKAFSHLQSLANHSKCHSNPDRHLKEFIKPLKRTRTARKKIVRSNEEDLNELVSQATSTQVKKRGRPATKNKNANSELIAPTNGNVSNEVDSNELVSHESSSQIKKRGRPATNSNAKTSTDLNEDDGSLIKPLKKRGRPKKVAVDLHAKEKTVDRMETGSESSLLGNKNVLESSMPEIKQEQDMIDIGPVVIQES